MYPQSMFSAKKMKNIKKIQLKIVILIVIKIRSILHRLVFVMILDTQKIVILWARG